MYLLGRVLKQQADAEEKAVKYCTMDVKPQAITRGRPKKTEKT
jgi:hypothetical protein